MAKRVRECIVCHSKYEYCPHCEDDKNKPIWMACYCSEDCQTILDTATKFNRGSISVDDAYRIVSKCDMSKRDNWSDVLTSDMDKILSYKSQKTDAENDMTNDKKFDADNASDSNVVGMFAKRDKNKFNKNGKKFSQK